MEKGGYSLARWQERGLEPATSLSIDWGAASLQRWSWEPEHCVHGWGCALYVVQMPRREPAVEFHWWNHPRERSVVPLSAEALTLWQASRMRSLPCLREILLLIFFSQLRTLRLTACACLCTCPEVYSDTCQYLLE